MVDRLLLLQLLANQAISVLLPFLVAVVTTKWASGFAKAATLALLAVATGLLNEALTTGFANFDWVTGLILAFFAWMQAVGAYYGFLRPSGLTNRVTDATAQFGLGPRRSTVEARPEAAA